MILDALKHRLRGALARPAPMGSELAAVRHLAETLGETGAWTDVDYRPSGGAWWSATIHLERVLKLARARERCPGDFDGAFVRSLDFWLARDFAAPDAWHHQIGVPRLIGSSALLGEDVLSAGARGKISEILARPRWSHWQNGNWTDWQATHLAVVAFNVLLRGCYEGVESCCQQAFERVYAEMRVAPMGADGIQADMSFLQRDAASAADRHGLTFAENCAQFLVLGHGTTWQAPTSCLALFASFLLDGLQWTIRRRFCDDGLPETDPGRPIDDLDGLAVAVEKLSALGATSRRAEMAAFARRLQAVDEPALSGHRHFWRTGIATHHRPAFYASVRTGGGSHSADGLTCLLRRGDEYAAGGGVWDRRRLPGITASQEAAPMADALAHRRERVGGVTDGDYGVAVLDLHRGGTTGRKAWFCFDESVVCLGSGISGETAAPVFTSINQCLARGPATAYGKGGETHVLAPGKSYDLSAAYRLEHDGVVYAFPEPMAVRGRIAPQGGREVFSLWIDHGPQPRRETYAYALLPGADPDARRATDQEFSQIRILANTDARQAVWHQGTRLVGIVFWEPGVVELPGGGRVAVNRPCVLLGQDRRPDGIRLSIANPTDEAATIHVEYANRCLCFNLPAGLRGGQSITRAL